MSLRLCRAMLRLWVIRGHYREGLAWTARALAQPGAEDRPQLRAAVLLVAGLLLDNYADYAAARAHYEEGVSLARGCDDPRLTAVLLANLGVVASKQGRYEEEIRLGEEALELLRGCGDEHVPWHLANMSASALRQGDVQQALSYARESLALHRAQSFAHGTAFSLHQLADALVVLGDLPGARAAAEESLALFRHIGQDHGIAATILRLGQLAEREGDLPAARQHHLSSLRIYQQAGLRRDVAGQVRNLAHLAAADRSPDGITTAARLYGAAEAMRESLGNALTPEEAEVVERDRSLLMVSLGSDSFAREWAAGRSLTANEALGEIARYFGDPEPAGDGHSG